MRPLAVVVAPPCFDDAARLAEAGEQVLVETLVTQPPDEALDEAVLLRLARRDVVPLQAALLLPAQDGIGGELLIGME
jgi:hypothetical protein